MKVIVAGATGIAGQGVVRACLADDSIDKVLLLTRRAVAAEVEAHPKVEVVLHENFSAYPDGLMAKLQGAEVCFWLIGGRVGQFGNDKVLARKVGVDYTLAGAMAMCDYLSPSVATSSVEGQNQPQPFRFVFCSGAFPEPDQSRRLLFLADSRKIKGAVEQGLNALSDDHGRHNGKFEVRIARPSGLVAWDAPLYMKVIGLLYRAIGTEQLGRAMIRMARGEGSGRTVSNEELLSM